MAKECSASTVSFIDAAIEDVPSLPTHFFHSYHSVRIDPVHYCHREAILSERRKKTSRFDKNGIPEDPAQARLRLFRRSVRDDPTRIGKLVQFLKIPYMLRESSHVELAQTIAVLPNLAYVDLPEGMFADEPSFATLRLEVQARCPNLRKMTYNQGSEQSLATLASGKVWAKLEVLELNGLKIDPLTMRNVLGSLTGLRALKVSETHSLSDEVLVADDGLPSLPPLTELVLKDVPRVTTAGLVDYLAWVETQQALKVLTLKDTGVSPAALQDVLAVAPALTTLALQSRVSEPFPNNPNTRQLNSRSLRTLRYEITGASNATSFVAIEDGYHKYVVSSILGGGLPKLRSLYVLDEKVPEQLQGLPPPNASFAAGRVRSSSFTASKPAAPSFALSGEGGGQLSPPQLRPPRPISNVNPANRFSSNNPFAVPGPNGPGPTHTLEVFTKGDEFGKWNFNRVDSYNAAAATGRGGGRGERPMSSYGLSPDVGGMGWDRGEARRSVMVGNGIGTFLAIPGQQDPTPESRGSLDSWRPTSSGGEAPRGSRDLWR